jgi:hypothetical protein
MHPLHDYLAASLSDKLKTRRVVVWYDLRREFVPFVDELRGGPNCPGKLATVSVGDTNAQLAEYDGSFFEVRAVAEPVVAADNPEPLLVYVPGVERDLKASVLMELEKAGECYQPQLKRIARNVLAERFTAGVIDDILKPERVAYEDLARQFSKTAGAEPPSMLKAIFHDVSGNDAILAAWLARDTRDEEIARKEAIPELSKLVNARLDLELPGGMSIAKMRVSTLRYVLGNEFRLDLGCAAPASLDAVPVPKNKDQEVAIRELARRLRTSHPEDYMGLADKIQDELGLAEAKIPAESLGTIDTFRFEERALLVHCGDLIVQGRFADALALVTERERSFWLDRDVTRKIHWEVCRRMAELGAVAKGVHAAIETTGASVRAWLDAYTDKDGWHRMDQAQRRLEALLVRLDDPDERPLGLVRRAYEDACHAMAVGFARQLTAANWVTPNASAQTKIFGEFVSGGPKPVAYFLVDSLRFEMGIDLCARLPKTAEVNIRPALASLPSITTVGMAALMPGASGSFVVAEQNGKLGCQIENVFLPDLASRKRFAAARVPGLVDMTLDELLGATQAKLAKKIGGAKVIVVRSQEIDQMGESGQSLWVRQAMDTVIDNLARGVRKLSTAGVEHAVITADHGHLFFADDRDESMRVDSPGGQEIELHRRCWIGRGGKTPSGCTRVSAVALGYASDLELVFPVGCGVFKAGGDLAFHHGGPSLQEMVVPVVKVRLPSQQVEKKGSASLVATDVPEKITNRIFTLKLRTGGANLALFASATMVRPLLLSADKQVGVGKQVGKACLAIDAEYDATTGCVTLQPGKTATVAFQLSDDSVKSLHVVVLDPTTDAELYRSTNEIPVEVLGA